MEWDSKTVLVTGGAGFIGSHLVEHLHSNYNCDIVVADDLSRGRNTHIKNLERVVFQESDLTTRPACLIATQNVDVVFHLAATVGGIHYIKSEKIGGLTPSVLMNQNILESSRVSGVDKFLFASSACVYRQQHKDLNRFSEDQAIPADPHSTYGWAKILGDIACEAYHEDSHLDTTSVRIFNAYGPRENFDLESAHVIPAFIRKAIEYPEREFEVFGDGTQERGFIYVKDLVEGMVKAVEKKSDGGVVNIGKGDEVINIRELAEKVIEISGKDIEVEFDEDKPEGTYKYAIDDTKMKEELGWEPETSLDEGLRKTYEWAEQNIAQKVQQ